MPFDTKKRSLNEIMMVSDKMQYFIIITESMTSENAVEKLRRISYNIG